MWLQTHEGFLRRAEASFGKERNWTVLDPLYSMFSHTSQPFIKAHNLEREMGSGDCNSVSLPSLDCAACAQRCVCSAWENLSGIRVFWKRKALSNHSYCLHYYHKIYRGLKMLRCNDSGVFRCMHCWLCIKGQLIWKWPDMADVVLSQPVLFITIIHLGKITGQVRGSPSKPELITTTFGSWDTSLKVPHFS